MSYLDQLFERATDLRGDVAEVIAPAVAMRTRAQWLAAELERKRQSAEKAIPQAAEQLIRGADLAEVTTGLAAADLWSFNSPASTAVIQAVGALHRMAATEATRLAPALWDALARMAAEAVAESVRVARTLAPGVDSERSAFAADRRQPERPNLNAWERLAVLNQRFNAVHECARTLLFGGFLNINMAGYGSASAEVLLFTVWRDPSRVPRVATELVLSAASEAGAGPALHPMADAHARWRRIHSGRMRAIDVNADVPMNSTDLVTMAALDQQFPGTDPVLVANARKTARGESPLPPVKTAA